MSNVFTTFVITKTEAMKTTNIEIHYHRHEGREVGRPFGAYALNKITGKRFYLDSYTTEQRREFMAPKRLEYKIKHPCDVFRKFAQTP